MHIVVLVVSFFVILSNTVLFIQFVWSVVVYRNSLESVNHTILKYGAQRGLDIHSTALRTECSLTLVI